MGWKSALLIGVILAAALAWIAGASAIARTLSDIADTPWVVAAYLGSLAVLVVALYVIYRRRFAPKKQKRVPPVVRTKRPVATVLEDIDRRLTDAGEMEPVGKAAKAAATVALFGAPGTGTTTLTNLLRDAFEPGLIDEVGTLHTKADENSRTLALARRASLPVLVVDNDMRVHEFAAIEALAAHNPKPLVVLNKADRFGQAERERLLGILAERLDGIIPPDRIVAVSAEPRPIRRESPDPQGGGGTIEREIPQSPDIARLIEAVAAHLPAKLQKAR